MADYPQPFIQAEAIWKLFTEERYRPHDDPREDLLLRGLWRGKRN